jgi:hypothetical protein
MTWSRSTVTLSSAARQKWTAQLYYPLSQNITSRGIIYNIMNVLNEARECQKHSVLQTLFLVSLFASLQGTIYETALFSIALTPAPFINILFFLTIRLSDVYAPIVLNWKCLLINTFIYLKSTTLKWWRYTNLDNPITLEIVLPIFILHWKYRSHKLEIMGTKYMYYCIVQ